MPNDAGKRKGAQCEDVFPRVGRLLAHDSIVPNENKDMYLTPYIARTRQPLLFIANCLAIHPFNILHRFSPATRSMALYKPSICYGEHWRDQRSRWA